MAQGTFQRVSPGVYRNANGQMRTPQAGHMQPRQMAPIAPMQGQPAPRPMAPGMQQPMPQQMPGRPMMQPGMPQLGGMLGGMQQLPGQVPPGTTMQQIAPQLQQMAGPNMNQWQQQAQQAANSYRGAAPQSGVGILSRPPQVK